MLIVHVFIHIKEDQVKAFEAATIENARNSIQEEGIARFDFVRQADDPTRFLLVEVYRNHEAPARHKETAHYKVWLKTVENMMAEPRTRISYENIYPDDKGWG